MGELDNRDLNTDIACSTTCSVLIWNTTSMVGSVKLVRQATVRNVVENDGELDGECRMTYNFLIWNIIPTQC